MRGLICALTLTAVVAGTSYAQNQENDNQTADSGTELPLPVVPSSLRSPGERAGYIIEHFWDALDFGTDERAKDKNFLEQTFVNYLSVFPFAEKEQQKEAVRILMEGAERNAEAYGYLAELADKYLYSSDSPMMSEEIYILFLEQIVSSEALDETHKVRPRAQLTAALKNRPGMKVPDFDFVTREGEERSLYGIERAREKLLIFYDPDCTHCMQVISELKTNDLIKGLSSSGKLEVLAIYSGEDRDFWQQNADMLPSEWTVGYEDGTVQDEELYVIRELPTLFLLDEENNVLLKEPDIEKLKAYYTEQNQQKD